MKKKPTNLSGIFLATCLVIFMIISCNKDKKEKTEKIDSQPVAYENTQESDENCNCSPTWFPHAQTPPPEEGKGSPFDTTSTTNCIFHQWSWQKFLWLTKPVNETPLFLDSLVIVNSAMIPVQPVQDISLVLTNTAQAGSDGILKANPDFNSTDVAETTYYSIHVNSTMMTASEAFKAKILKDTTLYNNSYTFPVGSLEVKVSWIKTEAIPTDKLTSYYQTTAIINNEKTTVAMLGMHVTGIVQNHPEFIWATFEHNDMAPLYNWNNDTITSSVDKLLYAKGSTTGLDGIKLASGTQHPIVASKAYTLFEHGVPRRQGNNFMVTSQDEPENFNNIKNIDSCVAVNLKDVWKNYSYDGSIWINTDGLSPQKQADTIVSLGYAISGAKKGDITRGSVSSSNLTMETFDQTFQSDISSINAGNLANCFSCHVSIDGSYRSPLYLSHIFEGYLKYHDGKSLEQINALRVKRFNDRFIDDKK